MEAEKLHVWCLRGDLETDQDTLRRLSNASLYFPSKFCSSFHSVLLHTPRGRPSDLLHLLKRGGAWEYQE